MKLKQLKIKDFIGIKNATVNFNKPVVIFSGANNQGKTSIRDALQFALTGLARGFTYYKQASFLAREQSGDMEVELTYLDSAGQDCTTNRTVKNASAAVEMSRFVPYLLNPIQFIVADQKTRGSILGEAVGAKQREVAETAISDIIGDFPETILPRLKAARIDLLNPDELREAVIDQRKGFKRDLKEIEGMKAPDVSDFNLPADFDLAKNREEIKFLNDDIAEKREAISLIQCASGFDEKIKQKKADIQSLTEKIRLLQVGAEDLQLLEDATVAETMAKVLIDKKVSKNSAKTFCPACRTLVEIKKIEESREYYLKLLNEKKSETDKIKRKQVQHNQAEAELSTAEALLEQAESERTDIKIDTEKSFGQIETEIVKQGEQLVKLQGYVQNYQNFKSYEQNYDNKQSLVEDLNRLVKFCDFADDKLKDGGEVKSFIMQHGRPLPIDGRLVELWGIQTLEWTTSGQINYKGRPVELASTSEKYRIAAVIGIALAEISEFNFVALDEYEILDDTNATKFFNYIVQKSDCNVLIFTPDDVSSNMRGAKVYRVENATVKEV